MIWGQVFYRIRLITNLPRRGNGTQITPILTKATKGGRAVGTIAFSQNDIIFLVGIIAAALFIPLTLQSIYNKTGDGGWKAWVPFYNVWTFFTAAGMSGAWMFATIVPILGPVLIYIAVYRISRFLGFDGTGMVFLAIFLPPLWLLILALARNKSDYELDIIEARRERRMSGISQTRQQTTEEMGRSWALAGVSQQPAPPRSTPQAESPYGYSQPQQAPVDYQPTYVRPVQPNQYQPPVQ